MIPSQHVEITTPADTPGYIQFRLRANGMIAVGDATKLAGAIRLPNGTIVPMAASMVGTAEEHQMRLSYPALPADVHLYDVYYQGTLLIHGHIEARPRITPPAEGDITPDARVTIVTDYGHVKQVVVELGRKGDAGEDGDPGKSAYEIARANNYLGTEQEWLASLRGDAGKSAYDLAVEHGYSGSVTQWLAANKIRGADGKSAFDIARKHGFVGTEAEWLDSLKAEAEGMSSGKATVIRRTSTPQTSDAGISNALTAAGYIWHAPGTTAYNEPSGIWVVYTSLPLAQGVLDAIAMYGTMSMYYTTTIEDVPASAYAVAHAADTSAHLTADDRTRLTAAVANGGGIMTIRALTAAQYASLPVKDASTLYLLTT